LTTFRTLKVVQKLFELVNVKVVVGGGLAGGNRL